MSLDPGARLGPYEILAAIGAGGMGEVYRARDPRLGRDVAIKVMAATVDGKGPRFTVIKTTALFTRRLVGNPNGGLYGVSPDGQRFLLNTEVEQTVPSPMTVVLNWTASLRK
jgi:serine/threonine protein kinase